MIPASETRRIEKMERELSELRAEVRSLRKEGRGHAPYRLRVGKTTKTSVYPTHPANTYEVVFQDVDFTSTPGLQAPSIDTLSSAPQAKAHDISDRRHITENTRCLILDQPNGKRLLWPIENERYMGTTTSDLTPGGSTSVVVYAGPPGSETYAPLFVLSPVYCRLLSSGVIPSGSWSFVEIHHGYYQIYAYDCG